MFSWTDKRKKKAENKNKNWNAVKQIYMSVSHLRGSPEDLIYNTAELPWGLFYALTHDCSFDKNVI